MSSRRLTGFFIKMSLTRTSSALSTLAPSFRIFSRRWLF
jgi:hypothetical protein